MHHADTRIKRVCRIFKADLFAIHNDLAGITSRLVNYRHTKENVHKR
ncbi:hypothetical protein SDC9_180630 [bioreactor metagenome]|uniref:Uncharacterized protein n=1 Tax=bioreactor metagenome TaxID=1076179 RepID=A0A645H297_9ZZZZ